MADCQKNGDVVRQAIVHQSATAYILELSDQVHRLIGVQKQKIIEDSIRIGLTTPKKTVC